MKLVIIGKYTNCNLDCDENLTENQKYDLKEIITCFRANSGLYEQVSEATNIPSILIIALHYREADLDFTTYLGNGDPLGKETVNVPSGLLFNDWYSGAVDALTREKPAIAASGITKDCLDFGKMITYATYFNGLGYLHRGVSDPYTLAGTDCYFNGVDNLGGKYTSDGVYSPTEIDKEVGVLIILRTLAAIIY